MSMPSLNQGQLNRLGEALVLQAVKQMRNQCVIFTGARG